MNDLDHIDLVVAIPGPDGTGQFLDVDKPLRFLAPGAMEGAYLWENVAAPRLPSDFGRPSIDAGPPPAGGAKFELICFPAHSAGKLDVRRLDFQLSDHPDEATHFGDDPGMHRTDTIDYEIVISGKIDIVLESGARRTLRPGTCQVMGGVKHCWENIYDEDCIFAVVMVGGFYEG